MADSSCSLDNVAATEVFLRWVRANRRGAHRSVVVIAVVVLSSCGDGQAGSTSTDGLAASPTTTMPVAEPPPTTISATATTVVSTASTTIVPSQWFRDDEIAELWEEQLYFLEMFEACADIISVRTDPAITATPFLAPRRVELPWSVGISIDRADGMDFTLYLYTTPGGHRPGADVIQLPNGITADLSQMGDADEPPVTVGFVSLPSDTCPSAQLVFAGVVSADVLGPAIDVIEIAD